MILEELRDYLMANGVSNVYMSQMPDTPDDVVCLYEYGGLAPEFAHDGQAWQNPRVQAVARNANYAAARAKAQTVYNLLNGRINVTMGSFYLKILALQSPFPLLGPNENDRPRLVVNFDIAKE